MEYTYNDLVGKSASEQATALRSTYPGGEQHMTVTQLREKLADLPGDAVVCVPTRQSREHGAAVADLIPVWLSDQDVFIQDPEADRPNEHTDGFPSTGVLYGIMLDPGEDTYF